MAISPTELEKFLDKEVDDFEKYFDDELKKKTLYRGESIYISGPSNFYLKHFNALKKRYLAVGWSDVTFSDSQRDGTTLTFKY